MITFRAAKVCDAGILVKNTENCFVPCSASIVKFNPDSAQDRESFDMIKGYWCGNKSLIGRIADDLKNKKLIAVKTL